MRNRPRPSVPPPIASKRARRRDTPARRQLARMGWTAERLARACGFEEVTASLWLDGRAAPPEHLRGPIFVLTGVLPMKWRTRDEVAAHGAAMRAVEESLGIAAPVRPKLRAKALPLKPGVEVSREAAR